MLARDSVWERVDELCDQTGMTVLLTTHYMEEAERIARRIAVIDRGRKVADKAIHATSPEEVTGLITGAIHAA